MYNKYYKKYYNKIKKNSTEYSVLFQVHICINILSVCYF